MPFFEAMVLALYGITALSSGFNTLYFWHYRSQHKRRRLGALVLSLVSSATLVQSFYLGLYLFFSSPEGQRIRSARLHALAHSRPIALDRLPAGYCINH